MDYRPRPDCEHCTRPATEQCPDCDEVTCEVCPCSCHPQSD